MLAGALSASGLAGVPWAVGVLVVMGVRSVGLGGRRQEL
jgi:hypothetical protein